MLGDGGRPTPGHTADTPVESRGHGISRCARSSPRRGRGRCLSAGRSSYRLRDVLLLMVISGFIALLLNPLVFALQQRFVPRRGLAVTVVTVLAALVCRVAIVFGYPLINRMLLLIRPSGSAECVASAQNGTGWLGHLVRRYHVQAWRAAERAKLVSFGQSLGKPARALGKGGAALVVELRPSSCSSSSCSWRPQDAHLDPRPDVAGPGRPVYAARRGGEPVDQRLHAPGNLLDIGYRGIEVFVTLLVTRFSLRPAVGDLGSPGRFPPDDRGGAGRHPNGAVRGRALVHRRDHHARRVSSPTPRSKITS